MKRQFAILYAAKSQLAGAPGEHAVYAFLARRSLQSEVGGLNLRSS